jgi:transcriptional regulator with XRE-family HTH domain
MGRPKNTKPSKKPTQAEIAEALGLNQTTVGRRMSNKDINEAKRVKLLREIERIEWNLSKDRREYIHASLVTEAAMRASAVFCSQLDALLGDAPGLLAGLDEVGVMKLLRARVDAMKRNIREDLERLSTVNAD